MPINVETPESPGWWLQKLASLLLKERPRLQKLRDRYEGDAPCPEGPQGEARKAYETFVKKARVNYAELVVEALRERLRVTGFRTAAADDENGDAVVRSMWDANRGDVLQADVTEWCLSMSRAYVIVGLPDGQPVMTAEDPRQVITVHDPVTGMVRAGLKMFHDDDLDRDYAYLFLPGFLYVAFVDRKTSRLEPRFSASTWNWDQSRKGLDGEAFIGADGTHHATVVPVVRFQNRRGVAEFEPHIDLLDSIDHQKLQRLVIATMQAFRQRAVKGAVLEDPTTGKKIPWDDLLSLDPGSVWLLPGVVEMWESGQVDLSGVLKAGKDDVATLAAVTRTPLPMLMPGDGAESAEGASFKREGLVFKAEDRMARFGEGWRDVTSLAFLFSGDNERADRSQLEVLWAPPERHSLAEKGSADSQSQHTLPWAERVVKIWGYSPSDVPRLRTERAQDALQAAALTPAPPAPRVTPATGDAA